MTGARRRYRDTVTVSFGSSQLICPASGLTERGIRLHAPLRHELGSFLRLTIPLDAGEQLGVDALLIKQIKAEGHYIWELEFQQLQEEAGQQIARWSAGGSGRAAERRGDGVEGAAAPAGPREGSVGRYKIPRRYRTSQEIPTLDPPPRDAAPAAQRPLRPRPSTGTAEAVNRPLTPREARPAVEQPRRRVPAAPDPEPERETFFDEDSTPVEVLMKRALDSLDDDGRPRRRRR